MKNFKLSGFTLALAGSVKAIFLFFLLFYILRKNGMVLKYFILTMGIVMFLSLLVFGIQPYFDYVFQVLPDITGYEGREVYYNQGISGFVSRIVADVDLRKQITLVVSVGIVGIAGYVGVSTNKRKVDKLFFSLLIIALTMVDSASWQHHFVWLLFPFVIIGNIIFIYKKKLLILLFVLAYILASWNFKNPKLFKDFPVSLMISNQFYASIILFGLNLFIIRSKLKLLKAN